MFDVTPLLRELGRRIRDRRTLRGQTIKELSAAAGVSLRFLSSLEGGDTNVSIQKLAKIAHALELPLATLFDDLPAVATSPRPVSLVGLRGAGKSTVGPLLAQKLGYEFYELDGLIEAAAGLTLGEIFALHGEAYYRRVEVEQLQRLLTAGQGPFVVATGGGIVTSPPALELIREQTWMVWLRAEPAEHMARVLAQGDRRPMKDHPHAMAELERLLAERTPLYAQSEAAVETTGKKAATIAAEVLERYRQ